MELGQRMGLEQIGKTAEEWIKAVTDHTNRPLEILRREKTAERVALYRDAYERSLDRIITQVFTEAQVVDRLRSLAPLVGGTSFIKRVAGDLARPLYARAPLRRLDNATDAAQVTYSEIAREMRLNARMDEIAHLLVAANDVFAFVRFVPDKGLRLDILTGADTWTIPHPEVPTEPLAVVYERCNRADPRVKERVVWDDKRYFAIDKEGNLVSQVVEHGLGILPIIDIHRTERLADFYDCDSGYDLVSQTRNSLFLDLIVLKKIKSQSHIQLYFSGDTTGFIKDQVTDEESVLISQGQGNLGTINLESDPSRIMAVKTANETLVKGNYGLAEERTEEGDVGLRERVAELASILVDAEQRICKVVQAVSRESSHAGKIPDSAVLRVDLGTIHHRVDRKAQLEIRDTERSMGYRSVVDDVLEDNPEFDGDEATALKWIDEKMKQEAVYIARRRALNISEDANSKEPGQSPEANGAMGPAVRDGKISKDDAAKAAKQGEEPDYDAIIREVLNAT